MYFKHKEFLRTVMHVMIMYVYSSETSQYSCNGRRSGKRKSKDRYAHIHVVLKTLHTSSFIVNLWY